MAEDYSRFDDSFDSEDVDFSSVLKAVLKSADTQADHWLQADAVQAINECIKGKRTSLVETLWKRISIEGESPSEDTYRSFVKHVCSGSLEAVESEKKTIMMPSHVLASLESRGFGSIAAELRQKEAKLITGEKKKKKDTGMTEQEMIELQQKLFAQAKAKATMDKIN